MVIEQREYREYQQRIISKVLQAYSSGITSVIIISPTGSGKTYITLQILHEFERIHPNVNIGWTAMRRILLKQAASENKKVGVKIDFVSIFDKNQPKVDILVQDECHHSAANSCIIQLNKAKPTWLLGLTSTPFRTDKIKLMYQQTVTDYGVKFLIEKGYLSNFRHFLIPDWNIHTIVRIFQMEPQRWGKSIIFMQEGKDCYELTDKLQKAGITAETILGEFSEEKREEILSRFDNGTLQVLVNVNLLVEGYNCDDLQTVWCRNNSKLPTIQMAGRVLRKDPNNSNKVANIIQSTDTLYLYSKLVRPLEQYLFKNDRWLMVSGIPAFDKLSNQIRDDRMKYSRISEPVILGKGETILEDKYGDLIAKRKGI
jgi:superfamily II DNA or RNA helicase